VPTVDSMIMANTSPATTHSIKDLNSMSVDELQTILKTKKIQYDLTR
jgi:hypothetical protein